MLSTRPYLSLIQQAALNRGLEITPIETDMIYQLKYHDHKWLMYSVDPGLNDSTAFQLAKHKSLTYAVLAAAGIPSIPHHYMVNPTSERGHAEVYNTAERWLKQYGCALVVKPDDGAQGRQVTKAVNAQELRNQLDYVFSKVQHAVISPYRQAEKEYRIVVLNGQAKLMFTKRKAPGEWRHNLALGAKPDAVESDIALKLMELAMQAASALGLTFCSVDVLDVEHDGLQILEVNGTVYLSEYMKHSAHAKDQVFQLFQDVFQLKRDRESAVAP
jgi:glutathione synthase/RimK-type ligase-like ATP-grasp enzyme